MDDVRIIKTKNEYVPDPKEDIIEDVPSTEKPVIITDTSSGKSIMLLRFAQVVWFMLGSIEMLLLFRFGFKMIGANALSTFTDFIYQTTTPLISPFIGILPTSSSGTSIIEWSVLIAMIVYLVIAYGILEILYLLTPIRLPQRYVHRRSRLAL